jgi:hypothetical protein
MPAKSHKAPALTAETVTEAAVEEEAAAATSAFKEARAANPILSYGTFQSLVV